ncbi:MAG: type IV toxin-antitoxin system AbiEi family antitoxin [Actinobacteria bacterium]|nr:type IV toxin-antitoxin system AbiEi family antitoxin [Actinomycetota bacterium]
MTARTIPRGLASLLELLELEQPRVVTAAQLAGWAREAGIGWPIDQVARRLRELGWLLGLSTKGVWEFVPASRAGAVGSGDPLIELRATLARDPSTPYAVAAESAAYLLGLVGRRPDPEVVAVPLLSRPPKALKDLRIVHWSHALDTVARDGLPTWAPGTLLAFMAARPSGFRDWPNVPEWLGQAASDLTVTDLSRELAHRPRSAWARASYLLNRGGQAGTAGRLFAQAPAGTGPYYLGNRGSGGRYIGEFDVVDGLGLNWGVG